MEDRAQQTTIKYDEEEVNWRTWVSSQERSYFGLYKLMNIFVRLYYYSIHFSYYILFVTDKIKIIFPSLKIIFKNIYKSINY